MPEQHPVGRPGAGEALRQGPQRTHLPTLAGDGRTASGVTQAPAQARQPTRCSLIDMVGRSVPPVCDSSLHSTCGRRRSDFRHCRISACTRICSATRLVSSWSPPESMLR